MKKGKCVGGPNHARTLEIDVDRVETFVYSDHMWINECEIAPSGSLNVKESYLVIDLRKAGEYTHNGKGHWTWSQNGSKRARSSSARWSSPF